MTTTNKTSEPIQFKFKQGISNLETLSLAHQLFYACEAYDKFMPKMYWHTITERVHENDAMDYLCFANDKLVGMLNILFFSDTAEFTVLVHPDYRGRKIFTKLRQIALAKLRNYVVSDYMLISPHECKSPGAAWDHAELEMRPPDVLPDITLKNAVTITEATLDDIPVLAEIHVESFPKPDYPAMVNRYNTTLREHNRRAFLARNAQGEIVGKIHAREDFNRVYVHDVGIKQVFRRMGYGQALMMTWLKQHAMDYLGKPIAIEVLGDNDAAIKLYETCGFIVTNKYHFWRFKI